jgi:hypothetical protein
MKSRLKLIIEWYLYKEDEYDKLELCADQKRMEEKVGIALAGRENVNEGEPAMTEEDRETLEILLEQLEPLSDDVIEVIQKRASLFMNEK